MRHEGQDSKLKAEEIDGKSIDIFVTNEGEFYAKNPGDEDRGNITAPTRAALVTKLRGIIRRKAARVAVKATRWDDGTWSKVPKLEAITITGLHGSNGNLLIKGEDGQTVQNRGYSDDAILRAMTTAEAREFLEMYRTMKHAEAAFETLLDSYKVNGKDLVRAAMRGEGVAPEDLDA